MKNITGFTLIELMIVIASIAIFTAIAIPAYEKSLERATEQTGPDGKFIPFYHVDMLKYVKKMRPDLYDLIGPDCGPIMYSRFRHCSVSGVQESDGSRAIVYAKCETQRSHRGCY